MLMNICFLILVISLLGLWLYVVSLLERIREKDYKIVELEIENQTLLKEKLWAKKEK